MSQSKVQLQRRSMMYWRIALASGPVQMSMKEFSKMFPIRRLVQQNLMPLS